ncbi:hypothetical protein GYMLUDRAFT_251495 [Collybiopsis luxurians FD-317 M1]|uniref:Glycan binding protein Y3-like domain-containing protein n=1 Tax=Collybiopsis luxurians FD-317 M1 TaxID=944289 RepID=A0A0D0CBB6_9AGAR|nr:hypothetical protein GYMLUDRAFT_251495 [Collybiopsis luxurians FD-317 M1]
METSSISPPVAFAGAGDYTAWNDNGTSPGSPTPSACQSVLEVVAIECPMGGHGNSGGDFEFTMDPNEGVCGLDATSNDGST